MVLDGRGERSSYLAGHAVDGDLTVLAHSRLPSSLGLVYEELTAHLGYRRSSDEYKVMALASYGTPRHLERFRELVRADGDGTFTTEAVDWSAFAAPGRGDGTLDPDHADLASTVQVRLQEVLLDLARWLHERTGERALTLAGGVALNCVANSHLYEHGPSRTSGCSRRGDAGTALGAAIAVAHELGDRVAPMRHAALGRGWDDDALRAVLQTAKVPYEQPADIAEAVAQVLADDGSSRGSRGAPSSGPRRLGHRSLLATPGGPRTCPASTT
jgi:carbamoyltransferase